LFNTGFNIARTFALTARADPDAYLNSSRTKTTVVLADDNQAMLEETSRFLQSHFEILATVPNGALAVQTVADLHPDIVVLDIAMPVMGGIEAARTIKRISPTTKIVFLTIQLDQDYVEAAVEIDASYVLKPRMRSDLLTAINEALAGREFVSVFQEL
jgi:DNA-binding NarL/FixJ family response regulator